MNSITIIEIVVVSILTIIIFGLTWLAYSSCIKSYKLEVSLGKHDEDIKKEYHKKKKGGLIGLIGSYVVLFALISLFATGIFYKVNNNNLLIKDKTALVIKSGSMSDFYDDRIAQDYNYDRSLQFNVGDICIFEKVNLDDNLVEGEVYGYKYKDIIITHRLVSTTDSYCKFRGDNNPTFDGSVLRENVLFHYTGEKIKALGNFVLYAQSYFGLWSLIGALGVTIGSEIVYYNIDKINKERNKQLGDNGYEE